ncbi:MAG: hypothetical protein MUF54_13850 [Polyangiaceae bacterium]|jgi:hypothetical protein|nr:hypothetical protein [Polyangiaceae bacterium]
MKLYEQLTGLAENAGTATGQRATCVIVEHLDRVLPSAHVTEHASPLRVLLEARARVSADDNRPVDGNPFDNTGTDGATESGELMVAQRLIVRHRSEYDVLRQPLLPLPLRWAYRFSPMFPPGVDRFYRTGVPGVTIYCRNLRAHPNNLMSGAQ